MFEEHVVGQLLRVLPHRRHSVSAVGQGVDERVPEHVGHGLDRVVPETMSRQDAAQRQGSRRGTLPFFAKVFDQGEPVRPPGEATLVDADAEVGGGGLERRHDLGEHDLLEAALARVKQPVEQGRGGVLPRAQHPCRP